MTGGASCRVLVVDDEAAIRLLCRVNLELDGYEVREAGSLAEAREQLRSAAVDLVLLDLHLGAEVSHGLIAECAARSPRVPVVLVTGSADVESVADVGADAVLPKPFEIALLAETVRRLTVAASR